LEIEEKSFIGSDTDLLFMMFGDTELTLRFCAVRSRCFLVICIRFFAFLDFTNWI